MKSVDEYGETITELSKFVERLDESVRGEAFRFLLAEEVNGSGPRAAIGSLSRQRQYGGRELAPQEVIRSSGREKLTDKAIVLGFWIETHGGKQSFSSTDLKGAFETAREKAPKNPSDIVASLEQTGRLMKAEKVGGAQHYRLTGTAIQEVEAWLAAPKGE